MTAQRRRVDGERVVCVNWGSEVRARFSRSPDPQNYIEKPALYSPVRRIVCDSCGASSPQLPLFVLFVTLRC